MVMPAEVLVIRVDGDPFPNSPAQLVLRTATQVVFVVVIRGSFIIL